jgi:peptide/nickel transport system substrate-binding protein
MLTALLSACSKSSTESDPAASGPDVSSSVNPGQPLMGGDLVVALPTDIDDPLDPHATFSAETRQLLFNIFEGLVKPDTAGNFNGAVASSFEISEGGDVFTFKLRDGVKFHNGETVTAADVVYSITRVAGLETGEPLLDGIEVVDSVEATDEKTVAITLSSGNVEALALMTAAIIPEGSDPAQEPIGTGPFRFVSRSPQENVVIEKFADYWGTPAYVDSVTYNIIESAETQIMSLMSGAVDLVAHLTSAQVAELGEGFNVVEGTMNLVQAVYLNNAVEPFNKVEVRRALCYALDKQGVLDLLSDGKGTLLGSSVYPAFTRYFREDLISFYPHDVEKAKQLLAEAGYPEGFDMTISIPSNYTPHIDTATIVAEQLKEIGVNVSIDLIDWNSWVTEVYGGRNFQATLVGLDASTLTARKMLERFETNNSKNFINFSDAEYDEVFLEASTTTDSAQQVALYGRLQEILAEQAANLYIQDLCDFVVMQPDVAGYEFYPLYVMDMSKIYFTA